jgi:Retrotransposon gag protein
MIYFTVCSDHFPSDQARIHWALSFFKTDHTAHFANRVLHLWRKGKACYLDWDAFEEDFIEHFCPRDEQLSAITKLKGTSWHQGKDSIKDYIDHFQELIDTLGYSNDKTIVIKF